MPGRCQLGVRLKMRRIAAPLISAFIVIECKYSNLSYTLRNKLPIYLYLFIGYNSLFKIRSVERYLEFF